MRTLLVGIAIGLLAALPAAAQPQCVAGYQQMLNTFKANAGICAKDNMLMTSFIDFAALEFYGQGSPGAPTNIPGRIPGRLPPGSVSLEFTRNSAPNFRAILPGQPDGRWRLDGNRIVFNCTQPLDPNPMPQNEAFLECARVYSCGAAAAQCGMNMAMSNSGNGDCNRISAQCLAANPVPQGTVTYQATAPGGPPPQPPFNLQGEQAPPPIDPRARAYADLSPECPQDFDALLNASKSRDSVNANAAYTRLRQQCDAAMRQLAAATGLALPERPLSPRATGALAQAFNRDPNDVANNIGRPSSGYGDGGGGGGGADWPALLDFGIALLGVGSQLAGGWSVPHGSYSVGRGTDYRSLAAPPIRSGVGQGSGNRPAQRNIPSDITGTK